MTDEELAGWLFDTSPQISGAYANLGDDIRALIRGVYIYTVLQKPDVLAAIRARRDQVDQWNAALEPTVDIDTST